MFIVLVPARELSFNQTVLHNEDTNSIRTHDENGRREHKTRAAEGERPHKHTTSNLQAELPVVNIPPFIQLFHPKLFTVVD